MHTVGYARDYCGSALLHTGSSHYYYSIYILKQIQ